MLTCSKFNTIVNTPLSIFITLHSITAPSQAARRVRHKLQINQRRLDRAVPQPARQVKAGQGTVQLPRAPSADDLLLMCRCPGRVAQALVSAC